MMMMVTMETATTMMTTTMTIKREKGILPHRRFLTIKEGSENGS